MRAKRLIIFVNIALGYVLDRILSRVLGLR
jgi:hypothetical protein